MLRSISSLWTLVLWLLPFVSTGKADECSRPVLDEIMVLTNEAMLKNDFPDGSKLTIECAYGYVAADGSNIITCTGGTWSDLELKCKKKDCGPPKPSPNLRYIISDGTLLGSLIKPVCDTGYYLQGSSHRRCLPIGWSGKVQCLLSTCEKPINISNGKITHPYMELPKMDDVIEYSCNPGYSLIGNKSILCLEDGEYNSEPPKCIQSYLATTKFTTTTTSTSTSTSSSTAPDVPESYLATTNFTTTTTSTSTSTSSSSTAPDVTGHMPGSPRNSSDILYTVAVIGIICCVSIAGFFIGFTVRHHLKRKGSYDTGEALKTKEELLLKTPPNLTPI